MRLLLLLVCCLVFPILPACSQERSWDLIGKGYQLTADSAVDGSGNVFFTDDRTNRILKVDADGHISVWLENSGGAHGVAMGPDGRLYAVNTIE
jgi:gluconolactonase